MRKRIADALDKLAEWSGCVIAWLALAMVLTMFAVVVLRRGFGMGWIAMQEAVLWMHGIMFMLGLAYTLKHDAHVRVDVFYRNLAPRTRAWIDLVATLALLAPLCVFILWTSWEYVADSWAIREVSREAGGLPGLFLLKSVIPLAAVLLALQGRSLVMRSLNTLFPKKERR